jgi:uncharacterized membrane protein
MTNGKPDHGIHASNVDYESQPLERSSYVTAIIHLYRGEIARANTWRRRLDQTTNWAIFGMATTLGFAFNDPEHSHVAVQFANLLLFLFLFIEARRFRFFDVWRARIRKMEINFFGPILQRQMESPDIDWGSIIAKDLNEPRFHLTMMQAVRLRLIKNYLALFALVFLAWVSKVYIHPVPAVTWADFMGRLQLGALPPWACLLPIAILYASLAAIVLCFRVAPGHRDDWGIGETLKVVDR